MVKGVAKPIKISRSTILLILLIVFHLISNYLWISSDDSIPRHDENQYFLKGLTCFRILTGPGPAKFIRLLKAEPKIRPHLFPLTAFPFYYFGKESYDAACLSNNLFLVILIISVYRTGKLLQGKNTGLLAAFIVSFYPFVVRYSRLYWSEICLMAFFALGIFLLFRTESFRSRKYSLWLGLVLALGMLAKQQFLFFMFFPVLVEGIRGCFFLRGSLPAEKNVLRDGDFPRPASVKVNFLLCLLVAAALTIPYYLLSLEILSTKFIYGIKGGAWEPVENVLSLESFLWYLGHIQRQLSLFLFALFLPGLVWAVFRRDWKIRLLIIAFAAGYAIFSLYPGKDARYISTLLPLISLITAAAVTRLRIKALKFVLVALIVIVSFFNFLQVSYNRGPFNIPYHKSRIKLPLYDYELHLVPLAKPPAKTPDWKIKDINDDIMKDSPRGASVLIAPYLPDFNLNSFQYAATLGSLPLTFHAVGTKGLYPYNYKYLLQSDYLVAKTGKSVPFEHLRFEWSEKTNRLLNNPPPLFRDSLSLMAEYPLPDQSRARLFKREKEPDNIESIEVIKEALKIDPENPWAHLALGVAYFEEERFDPALKAFLEVVELIPDWPGGPVFVGKVYLEKGQTDKAFEQINKGLALAPDWPYAHYALGEVCQASGRIAEAIEQYTLALEGKDDLPVKAREKLAELGVDISEHRAAAAATPILP